MCLKLGSERLLLLPLGYFIQEEHGSPDVRSVNLRTYFEQFLLTNQQLLTLPK